MTDLVYDDVNLSFKILSPSTQDPNPDKPPIMSFGIMVMFLDVFWLATQYSIGFRSDLSI